MGIVKRRVNARHWPREDRAGFLGVVTDRYDEVNGLIHDGGDVLGMEPLGGQMRELQGGDGTFGHLRLWTRAGGQSTNLVTQLVSENRFGHLPTTGVARAEYKNRLVVSHGLFGGVGVGWWKVALRSRRMADVAELALQAHGIELGNRQTEK